MTPDYQILADRQDITAAIADRLLSLRVTDESGIQSDMLELRMDDRDRKIRLPRTGAELELNLGYIETGLRRIGLYTVDEVSIEGPPDTLIIRARAADFRQSLKAQRTQSWELVSLSDIVSTIASRHGLAPIIADTLKQSMIEHVDQTDESDLHFLTRLGKAYGAIAKPAEGRLLFVPEGEAKTASGKSIPAVTLNRDQLTRWRFSYVDREKYQAVIAHWHNAKTGKKEPVRIGPDSAEPAFTLRGNHPDAEAAKVAAEAKLKALKRGTSSGSVTLAGDMRLMAEGKLVLSGFGKTPDGEWSIQRVEHSLNSSGLITSIELQASSGA